MSDRGRDVSDELTEVRTVLSRAENARETLARWKANETDRRHQRGGRWDYSATPAAYVGGTYAADPDVDDMIEALDAVIEKLARWKRTGRKTKA